MNRNEINIHERRGRTDVSRFRIEKTDGRIHREIQPDEREVSEGTQEVNISGSQNGRLRRTYDRDSAESRGENGRTASELMKTAGATEELKAADQMKWVGIVNNCKQQAEEMIKEEIIFS